MKKHFLPSPGEQGNTWTHLIGAVFALSSIWMVWPAVHTSWQMAFGVIFFIVGMFLMFLSSTIYHWVRPGKAKQVLRKCDHISIYVMIACSYTPICVGVIGSWLGWLVFGLLWAAALGGSIFKIVAIGKYPRLSLALYLTMGWAILLIFPSVMERLSTLSLVLLLCEGILYTVGTYFFANDKRPHYHAIWHVFVLLGAIAHWSVILTILL
ncbi:MAG: hemolysin III family protein [Bacteroidaceae bacterium]|nr:hemolysin III family protein [Bacteroidaceae bacterium]